MLGKKISCELFYGYPRGGRHAFWGSYTDIILDFILEFFFSIHCFMSFTIQFFALCIYTKGMCNTIIKWTFAMVTLGVLWAQMMASTTREVAVSWSIFMSDFIFWFLLHMIQVKDVFAGHSPIDPKNVCQIECLKISKWWWLEANFTKNK